MSTRLAAVPALVLAVAVGLTGCGSDDGAAKADKDAKATPGTSTTAPTTVATPASPPTSPRTSADQPDGGRVIVEPGLPSGFPKDDVPLIDAKVLNGTVGEPGSKYDWSVVLQPTGDLKVLADKAAANLEGAGFTAGPKSDLENLQVRQFSNAQYQVGFTATRSADGIIATYVVTKVS